MKKPAGIFLLMIVVAFLSSCGNDKQEVQTQRPQTGSSTSESKEIGDNTSITYALSGAINGSMTIKRNGTELKQLIDSEMMGMKSQNTIFIKGDLAYSITEVAGKKMAMKTSLKEYNNRKMTGETIADPKEFKRLLEGKKISGNEKLLGYECEIYDLGNNVFLSVADKKHILKIKSPEFLAVATNIQAMPQNSASEFELPTDVVFKMVNPRDAPGEAKLDSLMKELKK